MWWKIRRSIFVMLTVLMALSCGEVIQAADSTIVPGETVLTNISIDSRNRVTVTWKKAKNATDYAIYCKLKGEKFKKITVVDGSKTSYTYRSSVKFPLEMGKRYVFAVLGYNHVSKKYSVYNKKPLTILIPVIPEKVQLKNIVATKTRTATISWKKASGATNYYIYYKVPGGIWKKIATVAGNVTRYTHCSTAAAPLNPKAKYLFTVLGYNSQYKTRGSYDKEGLAVTMPKNTIPSAVSILPGNEGLMSGNVWNKTLGTPGRTMATVLKMDGRKYANWLTSHLKDNYYIGTPYRNFYSGNSAAPNGDYRGIESYPDMNCTSFVWHVLWKSMGLSGSSATPSSYGFGSSRMNTCSGWRSAFVRNSLERGYYKTKEDLMKIGKPKKGDLIYFSARGEGYVGIEGADNHIMIYMGDGKTDKVWHSSIGRVWCDGTYDNVPGGHWISAVNGNGITEIAGPQNVQFGYILVRAGAIF